MKKELKEFLLIVLISIVIIGGMLFTFYKIDELRTENLKKPLFCIKKVKVEDYGVIEYYGIGYKIIEYSLKHTKHEMEIGLWNLNHENHVYTPEHKGCITGDFTIGFSNDNEENEDETKRPIYKGIILQVNDSSLLLMNYNVLNSLDYACFTEEGNIGFKEGQEVEVYYNGTILPTFPGSLCDITNIKITKDKTDKEIPIETLLYIKSKTENVSVNIISMTNSMLSFSVIDTNEYKYELSKEYTLQKEKKNESYTGVGEYLGENTTNSTQGYTGTGLEYYYEDISVLEGKNKVNSVKEKINKSDENEKIYTVNFKEAFGTLKEGKYCYKMISNGIFGFQFYFTVDNLGKVEYSNVEPLILKIKKSTIKN